MHTIEPLLVAIVRVNSHSSLFVIALFYIYAFHTVFRKLFEAMGDNFYQEPEKQKEYEKWVMLHGRSATIKFTIGLILLLLCFCGSLYALILQAGIAK